MTKYFLPMLLVLIGVLLVGCDDNNIVDIEQANNYEWQKYMNSEEYAKVQPGMTYMDVVEIAGGRGELQKSEKNEDIYMWRDERLLTQAYEIKFVRNEVESMQVIELRGNSTRQ